MWLVQLQAFSLSEFSRCLARQRENSDIPRSDLWLWRGRVPHDVLIASEANQLVLNASNVTDVACTENARSAIERHNRRCLRWEQAGLREVYSGFSVACVENKLVFGKLPACSQRKQGCVKVPACSQRKQRRLFPLRTSWLAANLQKTSMCFIRSTGSFLALWCTGSVIARTRRGIRGMQWYLQMTLAHAMLTACHVVPKTTRFGR